MGMYKVVLADDHMIVREGLKMILEGGPDYEIVAEVENGDNMLDIVQHTMPDLIFSDLKMPGRSIYENCDDIRKVVPDVKFVIFTAFDQRQDVERALDAGIDGFILKDTQPQQIIEMIDMVMKGLTCYQPKINYRREEQEPEVKLTNREEEVFHLIVENLSNQEIADRLFISEATVKTHVSSILRKTGQPNRSQAVLYGLKKGFVQIGN